MKLSPNTIHIFTYEFWQIKKKGERETNSHFPIVGLSKKMGAKPFKNNEDPTFVFTQFESQISWFSTKMKLCVLFGFKNGGPFTSLKLFLGYTVLESNLSKHSTNLNYHWPNFSPTGVRPIVGFVKCKAWMLLMNLIMHTHEQSNLVLLKLQ